MRTFHRLLSVVACLSIVSASALGQVTLTINKSNNAPTPVASGVPFTYTIGYSWSGGVPSGGTLIIEDALPAGLDANYPYTNYPGSTTYNGVTNTVTYTQTGITTTAGSGVLQVYAAYKFGTTCNGTRVCDTARIREPQGTWVYSNSSCATASAANHWTFENELYAGCAACPGNDVVFRVKIMNPSGPYGGLNLTNLQLNYSFPAASGAVITGVTTGPVSPTVTGSVGNGTGWNRSATGFNTITVYGDPTTVLSVWSYWTTLYIHASFPCNQVNNTIIPTATLSYKTPCDTLQPLTFTDTAKVTLCAAVQLGSLYKDFYVTTYNPYNPYYFPGTITPNCCGTYRIFYTNTGTVAQSGVVITDTVPGSMDASQIYTDVPAGMGPVLEEVWKYPSGPWVTLQAARSASGTDLIPSTSMPVSKIRWTYSGSMAVSTTLTNTIDVCVRTTNFKTGATVVPTQLIVDTVAAQNNTGLSYIATNVLTVTTTSPHLIAEKAFVGTCDGSGAHPGGPWFPGDIVRFRIAVANLGSATATPVTITDLLPAGFSYQGNETYYYGAITPPGSWLTAYTPPCNTFTAAVPSQVGTLTSPAIGTANPTNCVWTFPTLPSRCDGTPDYFIIEFDVKVTSTPVPTLPGTYANNFTISATNATSATSNNAYIVISSRPSLTAVKEVRKLPGGSFGPSATLPAGSTGEYRLTVKNTGNVPLANVCLLDILPHVGDIGVLPPYAARNSMFNVVLTTPLPAITGYTAGYYANSPNPTATGNPSRLGVCGGFCLGPDAPGATVGGTWGSTVPTGGTYSFKVSANSTVTIPPGGMLQVTVPFTVPVTAHVGDSACNSFAYQCNPLGTTTCLAAEPVDVCIKVVPSPQDSIQGCCPCDSLMIAPTNIYGNIQTQWKTYTIFNRHCSPIDSINLRYYDCSTSTLIPQINLAALNGGNLHIYRNPSTNVTMPYSAFNASNRYQHMPLPVNTTLPTYGTPPTQDRVSFDLGLNYFLVPPSWCLRIIVYHKNGDSCVLNAPKWTPEPPSGNTGIGPGKVDGPVYVAALTIDPTKFTEETLGYVTVSVSDTSDRVIGGTGGLWESQVDSIRTVRPLTFVQSQRTALFTLPADFAASKSTLPLYVFIVHRDSTKTPTVRIDLYDVEANPLSTDSIHPVRASSTVSLPPGGGGNVTEQDLSITSVQPNPSRNMIDVQYIMGSNEVIQLELFNALGVSVGTLAQGYQNEGLHSAKFSVDKLPSGSYYLRLSSRFAQSSMSVEIVH